MIGVREWVIEKQGRVSWQNIGGTNRFGSWIPNSLSNYRHGKQNVGLQLTYRVHWSVHFLIYPGFPSSYYLRMCNRTKELLLLSARKPAIKEMKMWIRGGWKRKGRWSIKMRIENREKRIRVKKRKLVIKWTENGKKSKVEKINWKVNKNK